MATPDIFMRSCIEKERLLLEFSRAVSEYNRIQSAQVAAVRHDGTFPFREELEKAARRREEAKYAVLAHQEEHGC